MPTTKVILSCLESICFSDRSYFFAGYLFWAVVSRLVRRMAPFLSVVAAGYGFPKLPSCARVQRFAVAQDHGVELLFEQLLRRALCLRGICTGSLIHSYPDPAQQDPKCVAGEEEAVLVPQQRGVTRSVARRKDHAEARHEVT